MDLVAQVLRALDERQINPVEFERCSCALLQARYPGLSAVEGGHDFGRDGDIYFPFGEEDTSSRGRLLATTGDPVANLRTGLRRMREQDIQVDLVVVACLQPVNATQRAHLHRLCEEQGLQPPHIYGRDWLVTHLVREPDWRYRLLGVRGDLGALLPRPLAMLERETPEPSALVGRDAERSLVQSIINASTDVVLAGVPGVGKTRLTCELDRDVLFLQSVQAGNVVDELVHHRPAAVVVDDAHSELAGLEALRQARVQEQLTFSIIATTWPDGASEVAAHLPRAEIVSVERLERPAMDTVVRSVGITGHRARELILRQAEGRPGWALALCEVLVSGNTHELVTGAAHLANAERFLRRATESETALDTLACVAALTDVNPEITHRLAALVGIPPASLAGTLNRHAQNGLLERGSQGWSLQPALRPPLVARWFFAEPASRPWSTIVAAFPDCAKALRSSVIKAARVGSLSARRAADLWAQSLGDPANWDATSFALLAEYATLDEPAARVAIDHARSVLATERAPQQIMGFTIDPVGRAVKKLITQVARQWLLPDAVSALLDLAEHDTRPRAQNPDHPLRVLGDLARLIDPDFGTAIPIRERILDCTLSWLAEQPGRGRWVTATELLAAIFSPEVSGHWSEPGTPNTITISYGYESAANLQRLLELWPRVDQTLVDDRRSSRPTCPPEALALLVDLGGEWQHVGAGIGFGADNVSDEQREVGRTGARQILETLRPAVQTVAGLALRAQRIVDNAQLVDSADDPVQPFDLDIDLLDLVGGEIAGDDIEAELRERNRRIDAVAERVASLGSVEGTARFGELVRQAHLAGNAGGGHAETVAMRMRPHMVDPVSWYRAADDQHEPTLLREALAALLNREPAELPDEALTRHLQDPKLRPGIVTAVLSRNDVDNVTTQVIADLTAADVWLLDGFAGLRAPSEVLHHLMRHPDRAIAGAAALSFSIGQHFGPALPDEWQVDWATAIRNLRVDELRYESRWRAERLLGYLAASDPDLFEQWLAQRLDDMSDSFVRPVEPYGFGHDLPDLPRPHRERLVRRYVGLPKARIGQSLLTDLIGTDSGLAEQLLDDQVINTEHLLEAIVGQRNGVLEQLAPVLLKHHVDPDYIAAHAGFPTGARFGPESSMHREMLEYFMSLGERVPALLPVAQAGCRQQMTLLQNAERQEREERIRGL